VADNRDDVSNEICAWLAHTSRATRFETVNNKNCSRRNKTSLCTQFGYWNVLERIFYVMTDAQVLENTVARDEIEPPTPAFSGFGSPVVS
jgi:hypothetical protein